MNGWIVETLTATTLLMLFVLAVRTPVARGFGPRIAYLLWLLPALRMVLPPLPAAIGPPPMASALPVIVDFSFVDVAAAATPIPPVAPSIDWAMLLLAIWLGGAASHFVWHLLSYRRFTEAILRNATQLPLLDRDGIEVCASKAVRSPFAAGVFLKTIVLPYDYRNRYNAEELRLALSHETVHHLRCDMSANLLALLTLSLHWFNPIAWRAHRAFRIDQELACDSIVLANASPAERHAYGTALIKSTCDRLPVAACALGAGDLKRRLRMMGMKQRSKARLRAGAALATVLVGGGLALTASGGLAAETTRDVKEQVTTAIVETAAPAVAAVAPAEVAAWVAPAAAAAPEPKAHEGKRGHSVVVIRDGKVVKHVELDPDEAAEIRADAAEARADAAEAAAEARAATREATAEARAEAREAAEEARAEAREAAREAAREGHWRVQVPATRFVMPAIPAVPHVQMVRCKEGKPLRAETRTREGDREIRIIRVCKPEIDQAEIRRSVIESLETARESIAEMDDSAFADGGRREALASLDREIAKLRRQK